MTSGAKNRPKSKAVAARALELKASGKTREEVQATLAAEGHKVSAGWISGLGNGKARQSAAAPAGRALSAPKQASGTPQTASASTGLPAALEAVPVGNESPDDLRTMLRRQVAALEELAATARTDGNITAFATISRVVNATTALIAKLEPPARPNPEDSPDMVSAAKSARERLHTLIDRALVESGGGE